MPFTHIPSCISVKQLKRFTSAWYTHFHTYNTCTYARALSFLWLLCVQIVKLTRLSRLYSIDYNVSTRYKTIIIIQMYITRERHLSRLWFVILTTSATIHYSNSHHQMRQCSKCAPNVYYVTYLPSKIMIFILLQLETFEFLRDLTLLFKLSFA